MVHFELIRDGSLVDGDNMLWNLESRDSSYARLSKAVCFFTIGPAASDITNKGSTPPLIAGRTRR